MFCSDDYEAQDFYQSQVRYAISSFQVVEGVASSSVRCHGKSLRTHFLMFSFLIRLVGSQLQ
jgi:hypothetical protein